MRNFYSLLLFLFSIQVFAPPKAMAQKADTLKVLQYNQSESTSGKMQTMAYYWRPDIFVVKRQDIYTIDQEYSIPEDDYYLKAKISGGQSSNTLYYNTGKLELCNEKSIVNDSDWGDIFEYKLFYKGDLFNGRDTTFITCFVVNLDADKGEDGKKNRAMATQQLLEYCNNNNICGTVVVLGSLNITHSSEEAYENMVNWGGRVSFVDPVEEDYKQRGVYSNLDNRSKHFYSQEAGNEHPVHPYGDDILFMSESLKQGSVKYIPGSIELLTPEGDQKSSVKDCGCVSMQLEVSALAEDKSDLFSESEPQVWFNNPFHDQLRLHVNWGSNANLKMDILSIIGKVVYHKEFTGMSGNLELSIPVSSLENGMYLLKISDNNHRYIVKKLLKY